MKSYKCQVISDRLPRPVGAAAACHSSLVTRHSPAFSLIELLVVITILGLLAGIAVPALKDMGKSNVQISATRQLLDDVGRARQLAMSQRTTVYMVFVPTNFWGNNTWRTALTQNQAMVFTNLLDKQLSGYRFMSLGRLGDQPGQHAWHYIDDKWQSLPEGSFISPFKFTAPNDTLPLSVPQWRNDHPNSDLNRIYQFQTNSFPFPTEDSPLLNLPCIAFNHLGQLVQELSSRSRLFPNQDDPTPNSLRITDAYLLIDQGVMGYGVDANTKTPVPTVVTPADILERPPGNATNIGYNIVHIDALTGRATLEKFKLP